MPVRCKYRSCEGHTSFKMNNKNYYFVYKEGTGHVSIRQLNPKPVKGELYTGSPLDKDIKHFNHFIIGKKHYLSALKANQPYIYEIKFNSQKFDLKRINNNIKQNNEITNSLVIDNFGNPILFLHGKVKSEYKYYMYRIKKDGTIGKQINESMSFGVNSIDSFDSFELNGKSFLISYRNNFMRINELDIPDKNNENQNYN